MMLSRFITLFLCIAACTVLVSSKVRTKRYLPHSELNRIIALAEALQRNRQEENANTDNFLADTTSAWHPVAGYGGAGYWGYVNDQASSNSNKGKRFFDSLGGFEVHGFKKRSGEKRALDTLGGFQVHGWKRGLDSLGGFNVHGWKRGLDSLGGFNVHGWKRGLDSLGGFNVHGWKRQDKPEILGQFQPDEGILIPHNRLKRALKALKDVDAGDGQKRTLSSLGGFQVHGFKRNGEQSNNSNDGGNKKRALDSLGGFNVHGWKRGDDEKRGLDSLGGFNVHGWKRDDGEKRGLDSLGGFNVHGWKRDGREVVEKRGLDSLGGFNVHGWKRNGDQNKNMENGMRDAKEVLIASTNDSEKDMHDVITVTAGTNRDKAVEENNIGL